MANIVTSGKERFFRGKSIEELKKLDVREFAKFLKSRPRRFVMRNFNVIEEIYYYLRNSFVPVKVSEEMLGHRLGEFAMTRKSVKHGAAGVGATKSSAALSVK